LISVNSELAAGIALAPEQKDSRRRNLDWRFNVHSHLFLHLPILILARGGSAISDALNYVAGTLLFAGAALAPASALPQDPDSAEKTERKAVQAVP
jgi:hypothetical protein